MAAGAANVELILTVGQVIRGKVLTENKAPLPGAIVTAIYVENSRFFDTVTGQDGSFVLSPVPAGAFAVVAVRAGLLPAHEHASERREDLSLTLYAPRTLRGRVEREGAPIAGAAVVVEGGHRKVRLSSDAKGAFSVPQLAPGQYDIRAVAEVLESGSGVGRDRPGATIRLRWSSRWSGAATWPGG